MLILYLFYYISININMVMLLYRGNEMSNTLCPICNRGDLVAILNRCVCPICKYTIPDANSEESLENQIRLLTIANHTLVKENFLLRKELADRAWSDYPQMGEC